jgi:hypothetical protein
MEDVNVYKLGFDSSLNQLRNRRDKQKMCCVGAPIISHGTKNVSADLNFGYKIPSQSRSFH